VPDNRAIGALAAGHLIECAIQHFAYLGRGETLYREEEFAPGPRRYPVERLEGYRSVLSGHSHEPLAHFLSGHPLWRKGEWRRVQAEVEGFLKSLPAPCGLFVADDSLAAVALKAAVAIGRPVPESLAVIGYGDDHSYCYAGCPALSSIRHPAGEIGLRAARLLWLQMSGEAAGLVGEVVPVTEVVPRGSSEMLAIDDPRVREWVGWVRRLAPRHPLRVSELAEHAGVSLSTLKAAFATALGHSPKEEITRVRMAHLHHLLRQPGLSLAAIAVRMGFPSAHELARFCRTHSGLPPEALRHSR
jgi:LacI family transcriptional regulator